MRRFGVLGVMTATLIGCGGADSDRLQPGEEVVLVWVDDGWRPPKAPADPKLFDPGWNPEGKVTIRDLEPPQIYPSYSEPAGTVGRVVSDDAQAKPGQPWNQRRVRIRLIESVTPKQTGTVERRELRRLPRR